MKTHIYLILLLLATTHPAFSQPDKGWCEKEVKEALRQEISSRYGDIDLSMACYEFDRIIGTLHIFPGGFEISDPYGTLQGRNLFIAAAKDDLYDRLPGEETGPMVMGLAEGSTILWDSGMTIRTGSRMGILGKLDMTQDGNVEILVPVIEFAFRTREPWFLWIISWDGSNGKIINATDPDTYTSGVAGDSFRVFDYEVDGIKEIQTKWPVDDSYFPDDVLMDVRPCVNFSWNGSEYGMWTDTPQFPCNTFLTMDRLSINVEALVTQDSAGSFEYHYIWSNSEDSKQRISIIHFTGLNTSAANISDVRYGFDRMGDEGVRWGLIYQDRYWMVRPGETQDGFGLRDSNLPEIITYYVQGDQLPAVTWPAGPQLTAEERRANIYNNSVTGKTIGPKAIPENTTNTELADTLSSYLTQSCDLAWISNQGICRSLEANLDNVKRQLERGNTRAAANTVQAFLNELEAIREQHLSSEAYALLKFNGEYLLEKLQEE